MVCPHVLYCCFYIGGLTSDTNASKSFSTEDISINLPLSIFKDVDVENVNALFSMYNSSVLLPLANQSNPAISVASSVLGATIVGQEIKDTAESINVTLRLDSEVCMKVCSLLQIRNTED